MIKFVQPRIWIWSIIRLPKRKKTLAQHFHRVCGNKYDKA